MCSAGSRNPRYLWCSRIIDCVKFGLRDMAWVVVWCSQDAAQNNAQPLRWLGLKYYRLGLHTVPYRIGFAYLLRIYQSPNPIQKGI